MSSTFRPGSGDSSVPEKPALPLHVAVIDDDAGCRLGMTAMLGILGCKCDAYESVRAFLLDHALRRVDCIILDFAMPEINGFMAQTAFRETNYAGPIILCSGYAEEEIREHALNLGASFFLRKPVHKADLLEALQTAARSS